MKLVTFADGTERSIGVLHADGSVSDLGADPDLPTEMEGFVGLGGEGLDAAAVVVDKAEAIPAERVRLLAPIRPSNNVMAIGRNYAEHSAEFTSSGFDAPGAQTIPSHPIVFTKAASSIVGPGEPVDLAYDPTDTCDYEGELGVVIGPGGARIRAEDAFDHVYGYTIVNDVTVREVQRRHVQYFLGKSMAAGCPMGPCILTADEVDDVRELRVRTTVNGEVRQDAPVADLIFDIPTLLSVISAGVRLEAGDVIATGTPVGVGIGFDPPRFLAPGDTVEITIAPIGTLTTPIIRTPS